MTFGNFEEFWAALGRLYEASVNNTTDIAELRRSIETLRVSAETTRASVETLRVSVETTRASVEPLRDSSAHLVDGVNKLTKVVGEHEHRLDRHDMTIDAILEDLRRHREGRSPQ